MTHSQVARLPNTGDRTEGVIGIYVHIPFCSRRCAYCDFATERFQETTADRYLDQLERELRLIPSNSTMETVYIGGGTPSVLGAEGVAAVFGELDRHFDRRLAGDPRSDPG